jgi:serine/threonine-protein kinase
MTNKNNKDSILISNRYKIVKKIASGGTADVYLGFDIKLSRKVAIKILYEAFANNKNFVARFRKEAQILAKLNNPNIVMIYDWGKFNNSYYICMEYIEGQGLKDIIEKKGVLNPKTVANYTIQICNALDLAHTIKPENIIITPDGTVKVTDFGIAKSLIEDTTKTLNIIGTAYYISPEQAQGEILDCRTDIYSLGIVMYEMLTADVPFRGESSIDITLKHISEIAVKPSKLVSNIPAKLEKIIMHCLEKKQFNRYPSIKDLRKDLYNFLTDKPLILNRDTLGENKKYTLKDIFSNKNDYSYSHSLLYGRRKKLGSILYIILSAFFIISLLILSIIFIFKYFDIKNSPSFIIVPPLRNLSVESAENILSTYGLILIVEDEVYNSSIIKGGIIEQSPDSNTNVPPNSEVEVTVSKGSKEDEGEQLSSSYILSPNLTGLLLEDGIKILKETGLKHGNITEEYSQTIEKDRIINQDPSYNEEIKNGSIINLTISLGEEKIIIPDIIGNDYLFALSQLESLGLNITAIKITNAEFLPGTVVGIFPPAGSEVERNSHVELLISTVEKLNLVPDVTKMDITQAIKILTQNNLDYEINMIDSGYSVQKDMVLGQYPLKGNYIPPGSKVTLFVGK